MITQARTTGLYELDLSTPFSMVSLFSELIKNSEGCVVRRLKLFRAMSGRYLRSVLEHFEDTNSYYSSL